MSESKTGAIQVEGAVFYKHSSFFYVLRIALITMIIFALLAAFIFWVAVDSGARKAHKEARDIRKALHMVGTEYYSEASSIFDPDSITGLSDGAQERIEDISSHDGTVYLYEWDDVTNSPIRFEYVTGLYRVVYTDRGLENGITAGVEGDFDIYYSFRILNYRSE